MLYSTRKRGRWMWNIIKILLATHAMFYFWGNGSEYRIAVTFLCAMIILSSITDIVLKIAKKHRLHSLTNDALEVSPEEFFDLRKSAVEFVGVYILHNLDRNMYYVGQSVRVLSRVNQHFTGHGNGDVYADFKYGDTFTIRCLSLANSGYGSLDALEKDFIKRYNANVTGYNKTQGNL